MNRIALVSLCLFVLAIIFIFIKKKNEDKDNELAETKELAKIANSKLDYLYAKLSSSETVSASVKSNFQKNDCNCSKEKEQKSKNKNEKQEDFDVIKRIQQLKPHR